LSTTAGKIDVNLKNVNIFAKTSIVSKTQAESSRSKGGIFIGIHCIACLFSLKKGLKMADFWRRKCCPRKLASWLYVKWML